MTNNKIPQQLLVQLRKVLHKHPELSGQEVDTAKRITGFLKSQNPNKLIEGIGGHGVAAIYQYYSASPTVLIRCELDALPIAEENGFKYSSVAPGVSHKCGHDGHMAIVAGVAAVLNKNRPKKGRVVLLFQPAEEDGSGAEKVLKDKQFQSIKPNYVFALHNLPGYPKGQVVVKEGLFTASVKSMIVSLQGLTSHAAEPEKGINPALAVAEMLQRMHEMEVPADKPEMALITPVQVQLGEEAFGTSAGHATIKLTLRAWGNDRLDQLSKQVSRLIKMIASSHNLKASVKYVQPFRANRNDRKMVELVRTAAKNSDLTCKETETAFRWGEDFGLFTENYKGAMFGLGAGKKAPPLHSPEYDFPDEIISSGVKMFTSIIDQLLNK